jgi:hypothetical protein
MADEIASLAAQLHIAPDEVHNIDRLPNLFLGIECRADVHDDVLR